MRTIHFLPHSGILCGQSGGATKPRLPRLSFGLLQLQSLDLESHESHGSHGHPTTVSLFSKPLAESSWSFWYHLLQDQLDPVRHCSRLQITQVDSLKHHWETRRYPIHDWLLPSNPRSKSLFPLGKQKPRETAPSTICVPSTSATESAAATCKPRHSNDHTRCLAGWPRWPFSTLQHRSKSQEQVRRWGIQVYRIIPVYPK